MRKRYYLKKDLMIILFFLSIVIFYLFQKKDYIIYDNQIPLSNINNEEIIVNNKIYLDFTNSDKGYLKVKYLGDKKAKLQITKDETYTYDLKKEKEENFCFSEDSGEYSIKLMENIKENQYILSFSEKKLVQLNSNLSPFLQSNQFVDFENNETIKNLVNEITKNIQDDENYALNNINSIYKYVTQNITYDYEKAKNVKYGYLPNLNEILVNKKGICFDYASLMTAMLRLKGIPSKLIVGYADTNYHAWINVYINEQGWIDSYIYFDGINWSIMDPTFASSTSDINQLKNISYIKKYQY